MTVVFFVDVVCVVVDVYVFVDFVRVFVVFVDVVCVFFVSVEAVDVVVVVFFSLVTQIFVVFIIAVCHCMRLKLCNLKKSLINLPWQKRESKPQMFVFLDLIFTDSRKTLFHCEVQPSAEN